MTPPPVAYEVPYLFSPTMSVPTNAHGQPIGRPLPDWKVPAQPARAPLEGRYCRLEPVSPERHADPLFQAFARDAGEGLWTYLAYGPFVSLAEYRDWMEANCLGSDPLFFAICDLPARRPLGLASYLRVTPASGSIEVGHLAYSPALQQTAAATEAMYLMMRQAFELGYRRYEWKCDALNAPSRAAATRLGFTFEGIFRQATVYKGRNRDTAWYSIVDGDWPALRVAFETWLAPSNFDEEGRQRTRLSDLTRSIANP